MMRLGHPIVILITFVLITACSAGPNPTSEPHVPTSTTQVQENNEPPAVETLVPTKTIAPATPLVETAGPNCLGGEINPIGQSIAEEYDAASYEQVMTWFCNGAEFEDILVALETETQVDTSAEEMLQMLADGFTWDEIWLLVGLTD